MSAVGVLTTQTSAETSAELTAELTAAAGAGVPLPRVESPTAAALAAVAEVLATREDLWRRLVRAGGRRWSTRVAGGEGWEAWLVARPGGDRSETDPRGAPVAVVLLAGELVVSVNGATRHLVPGVAASFGPGAEPALRNPAGHLAVSLHVAAVRSVEAPASPVGRDRGAHGPQTERGQR